METNLGTPRGEPPRRVYFGCLDFLREPGMNRFLCLALFAALLGTPSFMLAAQDEGKKGPKPKEKPEKKVEDEGKKEKDRGGDEDKGGKPKDCGGDRDAFKKSLKKKDKSDEDCERETEEHFKKQHPDGGKCHCACDHQAKQKGNNGVGNGVDPQPPGNPPPNDGPGTGPGNPGNKGGRGKGKDKN
jgi:hypothetical protein